MWLIPDRTAILPTMVQPVLPTAAHGGPVSHAVFRVARLHRMLAGRLLREVGLHPGQETLLMHLWEVGPQRQTDLMTVLGSDSATITRTVQRLEQAGFVRRGPWPGDRRATLVESTPAGNALRARVEDIWRELERLTVVGMDAGEQAAALALLTRLETNLHAQCPQRR
jgi:DNA-binding MarR family transcriptional regulator